MATGCGHCYKHREFISSLHSQQAHFLFHFSSCSPRCVCLFKKKVYLHFYLIFIYIYILCSSRPHGACVAFSSAYTCPRVYCVCLYYVYYVCEAVSFTARYHADAVHSIISVFVFPTLRVSLLWFIFSGPERKRAVYNKETLYDYFFFCSLFAV